MSGSLRPAVAGALLNVGRLYQFRNTKTQEVQTPFTNVLALAACF
jgi:hypothetical protein